MAVRELIHPGTGSWDQPGSQARAREARQRLAAAKAGSGQDVGELLQHYRNYLTLLATTQIEKRLRPRVGASDIVQETMLRAHRHFGQFRGETERELLAWLRQILVSNLARSVELNLLAARRDMRREISIDQFTGSVDASTSRLEPLVLDERASPSAVVQQGEDAVALAQRMAQLPMRYRQILILRNVQGLSFEQIALRLNRSVGATRMLWLRAIEKLRRDYRKSEHET